MKLLKKILFEIKLFLRIKKVSSHLLGLYRGEPSKVYAHYFNALITTADILSTKRNILKENAKKTGDNEQIKRMKEIINRVENRNNPIETNQRIREILANERCKKKQKTDDILKELMTNINGINK